MLNVCSIRVKLLSKENTTKGIHPGISFFFLAGLVLSFVLLDILNRSVLYVDTPLTRSYVLINNPCAVVLLASPSNLQKETKQKQWTCLLHSLWAVRLGHCIQTHDIINTPTAVYIIPLHLLNS